MSTPVVKEAPHQKIVTFKELIPGIASILRRLPSFIKTIRTVLTIPDIDGLSLGSVLEENAVKFKNHTALVFEEKSWTYDAFNEEVNRFAHFFLSRGLKKGDTVVSFLTNRPEILFSVAAAAKIGATISLINFNLRKRSLYHCVTIMPCSLYLVDEDLVDVFEEIRSDLPKASQGRLYVVGDRQNNEIPEGYQDLQNELESTSDQNPSTVKDIKLSDTFCYIFTSGTTGLPKAAIQKQYSFYRSGHFIGRANLDIKETDRVFVTLPFFHSVALKMAWTSTHMHGAALIMCRKFSTTTFWDDVCKYNATTFFYVGELCSYLMNQPEKEDDADNPIQSIVGNGLRPEIWKAFKKRFGIPRVVEFYGASESNTAFTNLLNLDETIGVCLEKHAIVKYDPEEEVFIRDENGFFQKVEKGETGMLICESPAGKDRFTGYTEKRETEKKVLRDVFKKRDTWFHSGDLMRRIGYGHCQFADRVGDTFRWKGENVSTHEIEEIVNSFDQIAQSTTYGISIPGCDGRLGMTSLIPFTDIRSFDFKRFAAHLTQALPAYAVPRFLRFKTEFETTATHKIKKVELQKEGFDIGKVKDPLYVLLPGQMEFVPLTDELHNDIRKTKYNF